MTPPEEELERFFRGFTQMDRNNVEWWPEYEKAIKAKDIIAAMEIASLIITSPSKTIEELKKYFDETFLNSLTKKRI